MANVGLHEFIALNREAIITRCRAKVATRSLPCVTTAEIEHGVPLFLNQLVDVLRLDLKSNPEICRTAVHHGHDLLMKGFTVSQVVHDYGDVCQSITELAMEANAEISAADFHTLNRCLDDAIAGAVTEYGRERESPTPRAAATARASFAQESCNLVNTAIVAFEALKRGHVGVTGSTGSVLDRSLIGLRALLARSLAQVCFSQAVPTQEQFLLSEFIDEVAAAATLEANTRGIRFTVIPVETGVTIQGDRPVLAAVIRNLLQNGFTFTRPQTTVTLRARVRVERVTIEIEDECGGLPVGNGNEFEQRNRDRTGVSMGLAFSRWGVEANHGRLYTRNLPERGCIFAVDLPRFPVPRSA